MRFRISALALAAAMLLGQPQAKATVIAGGFTGQFHAGSTDTLGTFGTAGADLSGAVFNYQLSYDDALLYATHASNDEFYTNDVGVNQTITLLSNSASYTLNSILYPSGKSYAQNGALDASSQYLQSATVTPTNEYFLMQVAVAGGYAPGTILSQAGFDGLLGAALAVNANNFFVFAQGSNYDLLAFDFIAVADAPTQGEPTGDVPEPLSLAIMGAGLAGLGFLRRRI